MNEKPRNHIVSLVVWMCLAIGVLGLLMRYTLKDRVPALAVIFYALPPLVATLLLVGSLVLSLRPPRKRRRAWASGILTVAALVAWIQTDWVWAGATTRPGARLRVALWNLGHPASGNVSFLLVLYETDADIVFLVEAGARSETRRRFWESHFPDHHVSLLPGEIVLLSRYPIAQTRSTTVDGITTVAEYELALPEGTLSVVGVDVASAHCSRRRLSLEPITAMAEAKRGPVIVLGDFNTPHTSVLFDKLRRSFCQAFEESGTGLITTWPSVVPVLALDHIWLSEELAPVQAELRRTLHSDHALVFAEVSIDGLGQSSEVHGTNDE